ncbi:MAG: DUF47 family protein [Bacteroidales bacterium]|nr:DUF47 family protein [Bacteroidales bacterium]
MALFTRTTGLLINKFDEFLDNVEVGLLVFREGIRSYMAGDMEAFRRHLRKVEDLEAAADKLQREIENDMIVHSILPKHRVEVFKLLDRTDEIIDTAKHSLTEWGVEMPEIPESLKPDFLRLTEASASAGDELIPAIRTYFTTPYLVRDKLTKVYFFEDETDKLSVEIKTKIFQHMPELDLARKSHLRYVLHHIESISDKAQICADLLTGMAIRVIM